MSRSKRIKIKERGLNKQLKASYSRRTRREARRTLLRRKNFSTNYQIQLEENLKVQIK